MPATKRVGRTRLALLLDVGEPAINPVPRKMMTEGQPNAGFAFAQNAYQYQRWI